ncbi:MAG: LacI family DNA-binding transcriptional regulator, partial [Verrucomicrobiota bacterium]
MNQQRIADLLEIDRTTVSRSFSNHPKINPETRARVLDLAAQLGYRYKGQRAKKEQNKRKLTDIGVLIGVGEEMTDIPATSQYMLKGISERAAEESITLDVKYIDPAELDRQIAAGKTARSLLRGNRRWNGAILIFPFTTETIVRLSKRVSTVSIAEDYNEGGIDCIDVDHHAGVFSLVNHLAAQGHKRIGFCTWTYSVESPWLYRRFGAYVDSLFR